VILHAAALIVTGTAGFLLGGVAGAAAGVGACAVVLIARRRLGARNTAVVPTPMKPRQFSAADIADVVERLEDIARERNWSLGKRFDIARMACEYPTMTIEDLERRYDSRQKATPDP